jgi:hypothetical protein
MKSKWIRDYATGAPCCAVCGALKTGETCCPVNPDPASYDEFVVQMWPEDPPVVSIAKEFYEEYTLGEYGSVQEYAEEVRG